MPCEIIVWKLLPVLRKELAKEMKQLGVSQKEIAQRLGVTPAAVSQYIKAKRGKDLALNDVFRAEIKTSAKRLAEKSDSSIIIRELCTLCKNARPHRILCQLHHEDSADLDAKCNVCLELCHN